MKTASTAKRDGDSPRVSPILKRIFSAYSRRYTRRHFHAFRILKSGRPAVAAGRPLVVYLNHAAWWDPLVCLQLSNKFFASRSSYAPIDAAMFRRYGFFKHLGFFPIEPKSQRGAWAFLRKTRDLLASSKNALWLTPQGRFMDPRDRPLRLEGGLGTLATRELGVAFVPLAIEYAFWTEPRPEILVSFGEPVVPFFQPERSAAEWTQFFTDVLAARQDELAERSCRRDPEDWLTLDRGRSGVNGFYDAWRWLSSFVRGGNFRRDHQTEAPR